MGLNTLSNLRTSAFASWEGSKSAIQRTKVNSLLAGHRRNIWCFISYARAQRYVNEQAGYEIYLTCIVSDMEPHFGLVLGCVGK